MEPQKTKHWLASLTNWVATIGFVIGIVIENGGPVLDPAWTAKLVFVGTVIIPAAHLVLRNFRANEPTTEIAALKRKGL